MKGEIHYIPCRIDIPVMVLTTLWTHPFTFTQFQVSLDVTTFTARLAAWFKPTNENDILAKPI